MVVGAPDAKAYVYQKSGEQWNLYQELSGAGGFGRSVAISGTKIVVGMPLADGTYVFQGQKQELDTLERDFHGLIANDLAALNRTARELNLADVAPPEAAPAR